MKLLRRLALLAGGALASVAAYVGAKTAPLKTAVSQVYVVGGELEVPQAEGNSTLLAAAIAVAALAMGLIIAKKTK